MSDARVPSDVANLAALLQRRPTICTDCIQDKLALSMERIFAALHAFGKTHTIQQGTSRCPVCRRTKWVVSLVK
jgi:uncharacterized protein with PIN domain